MRSPEKPRSSDRGVVTVVPDGMAHGLPMCRGCREVATGPGIEMLRVVARGPEDEEAAEALERVVPLLHQAMVAAIERAEAQRVLIPRPEVTW